MMPDFGNRIMPRFGGGVFGQQPQQQFFGGLFQNNDAFLKELLGRFASPSQQLGMDPQSYMGGPTADEAGSAGGVGGMTNSASAASNPASGLSMPATASNVANAALGLVGAMSPMGMIGMIGKSVAGKDNTQSTAGKGLMGLLGLLGLDQSSQQIGMSPAISQAIADMISAASNEAGVAGVDADAASSSVGDVGGPW